MQDALHLGGSRAQLGTSVQPADDRHDVAEAHHRGQSGQPADQLDGRGVQCDLLVSLAERSLLGGLPVVETPPGS